VGASLGVAWGLYRYALSSPRFAIREVAVEGRKRTTETEILKLAGIQLGANIFRVDPRRAEAALLENPWIQEAKVVRDLPGKVRIEIAEREAVALAALGEHLYLVTRLGEPFKEVQEGDPYDLPVLSGLTLEGLARDRAAELSRARGALEVLSAYGKLPLSRVHVAQEVALTPTGEVVVTVGKPGISLHIGKGPWTTKLIMAERVLGKTAGQGQTPGIVFLDNQSNPERVVVRLR
jgi:cell division protein FtsQ